MGWGEPGPLISLEADFGKSEPSFKPVDLACVINGPLNFSKNYLVYFYFFKSHPQTESAKTAVG